jgi:hypothetical protein
MKKFIKLFNIYGITIIGWSLILFAMYVLDFDHKEADNICKRKGGVVVKTEDSILCIKKESLMELK